MRSMLTSQSVKAMGDTHFALVALSFVFAQTLLFFISSVRGSMFEICFMRTFPPLSFESCPLRTPTRSYCRVDSVDQKIPTIT